MLALSLWEQLLDIFHFRAELSETARDGDHCVRWLEKRGAPRLLRLGKRFQGKVLQIPKSKKRNLPFCHGNKLSCPRLESWQEKPVAEFGVVKETEPSFPCPFQRWEFPHSTSWSVSSSHGYRVEEPVLLPRLV